MQLDYATDIILRQRKDLELLCEAIIRSAINSVKADQIAMSLGRRGGVSCRSCHELSVLRLLHSLRFFLKLPGSVSMQQIGAV
jgi:hypothetical protein